MSKYLSFRFEKVNSSSALAGRARHNLRETQPENADPSEKNAYAASMTSRQVMAQARGIWKEIQDAGNIVRSNSVLAVEAILGIGRDAEPHVDKAKFREAAAEWAAEKFGKENVLQISVHRDEQQHHLHVLFVPRTKDGRLNFKEIAGGRDGMRKWQTDAAKALAEPFGMVRGRRGSRATHQRLSEFYERLSRDLPEDLPKPTKRELKGLAQGEIPPAWREVINQLHDVGLDNERLTAENERLKDFTATPETLSRARDLEAQAQAAMERIQAQEREAQEKLAEAEKQAAAVDQEARRAYRPNSRRNRMRAADERIQARVRRSRRLREPVAVPVEQTTAVPKPRPRPSGPTETMR